VIPAPLWVVLFFASGVIFLYMLFFSDSGERAVVQAMLMGSVVAVIVAMLLLLRFLDNPSAPASAAFDRWPWSERCSSSTQSCARLTGTSRSPAMPAEAPDAMTDRATNEPVNTAPKRDWVEIVAAVLLALAAVATAWSSYQATRWNGEQTKASSRTNAIRIQATRAASLAEAETEIEVETFIQWIDAHASKNTALADFYRKRFRPEFKPAFNAWTATRPFTNPDAPLTPFAMPQYRLAATAEAERLDKAAEASSAAIRRNLQHAANYVLGVVLSAVALFFAGLSTKLHAPGVRKAMLVVGCVLFVATAAWIATFPVSVSI
jgi:hypothetical protein